jgi:ABC-type branched-subunit amino acid transport system ATPase component/ABC-type branched-subunit amino acid transport system permease subunit
MALHPIKTLPGRNRMALFYAVAAVTLLSVPLLTAGTGWLRIFTMSGLYVMLALGLNVVAGFAGLLDLAYVAFFGIGGYLFAILSSGWFPIGLPFLITLPLAALAAMTAGVGVGAAALRLKGEYVAIVTLAFAQIFRLFLVNLDRPVNITGGIHGLYDFYPIHLFGFKAVSPLVYAYLIWSAALLIMFACFNLKRSLYGLGWEAIREDEPGAQALGVNTSMMKLKAFSFGALIAGFTGALFASFQDAVFPHNFDFPQLVTVYCMVVLGGLGNVAGSILGAVLLSILFESLGEYSAYRFMLSGLILMVVTALKPQGIMGFIRLSHWTKTKPEKDAPNVIKASCDLHGLTEGKRELAREGTQGKGAGVALQIKGVSLNFMGIGAVDNVSFEVREREILSIIGPNGAGKTTLFNIISGFYPALSGAVFYKGKNLSGLKPHQIANSGIARTFQNPRLFKNMTILDNIKVARLPRITSGLLSILLHSPLCRREGRAAERTVKEVLGLFGESLSGEPFTRQASSLSHADRRRLEIARAISTGAKLLMLDEPSAGMSPGETEEIGNLIRKLRDDHGFTILVIEHRLKLVQSISDRVMVLASGGKIAEGSYEEVARDPHVLEACYGRKALTP